MGIGWVLCHHERERDRGGNHLTWEVQLGVMGDYYLSMDIRSRLSRQGGFQEIPSWVGRTPTRLVFCLHAASA